MYDLIGNLWLGMSVAITPTNIGLVLIGSIVGTLIGVLPGIGSLATIAMLLPITFSLPPVGALIMLAGIYYGAQYGGLNHAVPGEIPRATLVGRDLSRRPPDGPPGPRRSCTRHRCDRFVLRRLRRHGAGGG